jgi:hypothetical protein
MARKLIKIDVSEADIKWGHRKDSGRCAVARAIARTIPDATRIEVDTQSIRFTSDGDRLMYLTPLSVMNYVAAYDDGRPVEPWRFQLRDPIKLRRRLVREESKPALAAKHREDKARAKGKVLASTDGDAETPRDASTVGAVDTRKPWTATETIAGRRPPPRVFKTHKRAYGHRVLRINQPQTERPQT